MDVDDISLPPPTRARRPLIEPNQSASEYIFESDPKRAFQVPARPPGHPPSESSSQFIHSVSSSVPKSMASPSVYDPGEFRSNLPQSTPMVPVTQTQLPQSRRQRPPKSGVVIRINVASGFQCGYEDNDDGLKIFHEFLQRSTRGKETADVAIVAGNLFSSSSQPFSTYQLVSRAFVSYSYRPEYSSEFKPVQGRERPVGSSGMTAPQLPVFMIGGRFDQGKREKGTKQLESPVAMLENLGFANSLDDPRRSPSESWVFVPTVYEKEGLFIAIYGMSYILKTDYKRFKEAKFVRPHVPQGSKVYHILVTSNPRCSLKPKLGDLGYEIAKLAEKFDIVIWGNEFAASFESTENKLNVTPGGVAMRSVHVAHEKRKSFAQIEIRADGIHCNQHEFKIARHVLVAELKLADFVTMKSREEIKKEILEAIDQKIEQSLVDYPEGYLPMPALILNIDLENPGGEAFESVNAVLTGRNYSDRVFNWQTIIRYPKGKPSARNDGGDIDEQFNAEFNESNKSVIAQVLTDNLDSSLETLQGKILTDVVQAYSLGDTTALEDVLEWMKEEVVRKSKDLTSEDIEDDDICLRITNEINTAITSDAVQLARASDKFKTKPKKVNKTKSMKSITTIDEDDFDEENPFASSDDDDFEIIKKVKRGKR